MNQLRAGAERIDLAGRPIVETRPRRDQQVARRLAGVQIAPVDDAAGITEVFVQENHSSSERNVLRGLHYQRPPHAQSKLVRVVSGVIFDVAVDLRPDSPTSGRWVAANLSADDRKMMYVPSWCAHGFCVLSERAEIVYHTSTEYAPDYESGVMWNDPALGIDWPVTHPITSERDKKWPPLKLSRGASTLAPGER